VRYIKVSPPDIGVLCVIILVSIIFILTKYGKKLYKNMAKIKIILLYIINIQKEEYL